MEFYAKTDIGKVREKNQDQAGVVKNAANQILGIVCDGMGGHRAGEIASALVKNYVVDEFSKINKFENEEDTMNWMLDVTLQAHNLVKEEALKNEENNGMGTTIALAIVDGEDSYFCHVGDSRIYLYDDESIEQVTTDHTLVNVLVERGMIPPEAAKTHPQKNILMQAIGADLDLQPDVIKYEGEERNILICSDGLYNSLEDEEILMLVRQQGPIDQKVAFVIDQANKFGGNDNIAVVLIEGGRDDE